MDTVYQDSDARIIAARRIKSTMTSSRNQSVLLAPVSATFGARSPLNPPRVQSEVSRA
jgi:hypothetical protein